MSSIKSLFNPDVNKKIVDRIMQLDSAQSPAWGKMSAAQMVVHSQKSLQVALGELELKRGLIGLLFGNLAKKRLLEGAELKRNLTTSPQFLVKEQPEFIKERNKLIALVKAFKDSRSTLVGSVHPFFGKMTVEEWDLLQWKHLDHHLRQFGV